MSISPLKVVLTEVGGGCQTTAAWSFVVVAGEIHIRKCALLSHPPEPSPDAPVLVKVGCAEPKVVSARHHLQVPQQLNVPVGMRDNPVGGVRGVCDLPLLRR